MLTLQWIQITLFVVAVAIAIYSLVIANKSLAEAEKTRRDTFLPTVICKPKSTWYSGKYVLFYLQNVGHGIALNPEFQIWGLKGSGAMDGYLCSSVHVEEKKPLNFLDHRISEGFHHLAFDLGQLDPRALSDSELKLKITYNDVFERQIETTYSLTLAKEEQHYLFHLGDLQVHLP